MTGARVPLDVMSVSRERLAKGYAGLWRLVDDRHARPAEAVDVYGAQRAQLFLYEGHHLTCPDAASFRGPHL